MLACRMHVLLWLQLLDLNLVVVMQLTLYVCAGQLRLAASKFFSSGAFV